MESFSQTIRTRLRKLIADKGYTNRSIERDMGRGNNWIGRKLSGDKRLYVEDVDEVLDHLGASPDELLKRRTRPAKTDT